MARDDEAVDEDGRPARGGLRDRMPEAGLGFFGTFLLALVIGFLLVMSGQDTLALIVFGVAIFSILSMLLTPSPQTRAKRAAMTSPGGGTFAGEGVDGEGEPAEGDAIEGPRGPDLVVDRAAPTRGRRDAPAPPPEPPPMDDIVVDAEDGAGAGDDDDLWVE